MDIRETYIEVMNFLAASGGSYTNHDTQTCRDIIDAIINKQCRIVRDQDGHIVTFTSWWMIHEIDLERVKNGFRPRDIFTGNIAYISDHAGAGAYPEMIRFIKSFTDWGCWHHRYKHPDRFRQYKKRGIAHV